MKVYTFTVAYYFSNVILSKNAVYTNIASKIKVFCLHNICVYVLYVFIMYIKIQTNSIYILKIFTYIYMYIFIFI